MRGQNFPFTTPEVNGTFNNWCGDCNVMTDADGDSIWEAVISLPNGIVEYKFSTDDWTNQETLPNGTPCTLFTPPSFNNRKLIVVASQVLKAVCWGSCDTCSGGPVAPGKQQIALPISWQDTTTVNYATTDFGGTFSSIGPDPANANLLALKIVKGNTAETWAGTTLGTPAGFAAAIPFAPGSVTMQMRVFSPASGTIFRLKAENKTNGNISVETNAVSSLSGAWETLTFNFSNPAPGTPSLIFSNTYNKLSVFPNFGVSGLAAGEQTYFIGDVAFGLITTKASTLLDADFTIFPNPSNGDFVMNFGNGGSSEVEINVYDLTGRVVSTFDQPIRSGAGSFSLSYLQDGLYIVKVKSAESVRFRRIQIRH